MMSAQVLGLLGEAVCVVLAAVTLGHAIRRRRTAPTVAGWLAVVMAGIACWALTGLVMRTTDIPALRVAATLAWIGCFPVLATGHLFLARSLVDSSYRPSLQALWLLVNPAALAWCLLLPGPRALLLGDFPATGPVLWRPGVLFWGHIAYIYGLFLVATAYQVRSLFHSAASHQVQLVSNFVAALVPMGGCLAMTAAIVSDGGTMRVDHVDWAAAGFTVTCLINLWSLHSQGLLSVLPVARGLVLQELADAVFIFDAAGHLVDRNSAADDLLARCGRRIARVTTGTRAADILGYLGGDVRPTNGEYLIDTYPPTEIDLRLRDICAAGRQYGTALVIRDITGLNRSRREVVLANEALRSQVATIEALRLELQDQANRDVLTGVSNRRRFEQVLAETYDTARSTASPFALAVVDIDHFKAVNDRHGHLVGDDVLSAVAAALSDEATGGEQVFRFGGEEFVIVLPGVASAGAASRAWDFADRTVLRGATGVPGLDITTSIGVAAYPEDGADPMTVLQAADKALYRAKALGRARVERATPIRLVPVPALGGPGKDRTA